MTARPRAFTLLETLLAVSLMAVVAAAGYGMMHGGLTARRVVSEGAVQSRSLALALDQVCRCVESALPPTGVLAGAFTGEDAADGTNDTLTLHTTVDPYGSRWADVRRVRFFVDLDEAGSPRLLRGLTSNLLASVTPQEDVQVLCRSVVSFQVQYFDGAEWLDVWNSSDRQNALPQAVRVSLTLADTEDAAADGGDDGPSASLARVVLPACTAEGQGGAP